ncbi:MAG: cupin domain-containing protein [Candidatus Binatia bacterium]|nr:cupin domain-containing protein [Candidatus Binatia bacterium]
MVRHINVVHISEVTSEALKTLDGSSFGALRQRVGAAVGANKLGYSFFTVPPGKAAFPFHLHNRNKELIYIVEGNGTLRLRNSEVTVSSETFIACPLGHDLPHQLINTAQSDLRYLVVSTMEYPEIAEYPDSNKIGAYVTSASSGATKGFRALYIADTGVSYYEGEDGSEIERVKKGKG